MAFKTLHTKDEMSLQSDTVKSVKRNTVKLVPTKEQGDIIFSASNGEDLVIKAFAGASKTSSLVMIANSLHKKGKSGLYLAFNKAISDDAKGKFPASVDCRTIHSLAYSHLSKGMKAKLSLNNLFANQYAERYKFKAEFVHEVGNVDEAKFVSISGVWSMVRNTVENFCKSSDIKLCKHHVAKLEWMYIKKFHTTNLEQKVLEVAKKYWKDITDEFTTIPLTHDAYLKLYGLSGECPDVDYILVDEVQDVNPIMLQIIERFSKQKILVGDSYQAIYQWNKTVNILDMPLGNKLHLTKSFRFGNNVEKIANTLLTYLGSEKTLVGNGTTDGVSYYDEVPKDFIPDFVLCRTNAGCISAIFKYSEMYPSLAIKATVDTKQISLFVNSYIALQDGEMKDVKHPLLFAFNSFDELQEYVDGDCDEPEIKSMCKLIGKFGERALLAAVARCDLKTQNPDIIISTTHKAKGLEADNVSIFNDFNFEVEDGELDVSDEELNLVYVAVTRAKKNLDVTGIKKLLIALENNTKVIVEPLPNFPIDLKAVQIDKYCSEKEVINHLPKSEHGAESFNSWLEDGEGLWDNRYILGTGGKMIDMGEQSKHSIDSAMLDLVETCLNMDIDANDIIS